MSKIAILLRNLALAYGGYSQFSTEDIGNAISGNIRNQGWDYEKIEDYALEAATILSSRWEDDNVEEDFDSILNTLKTNKY